MAARTIRRWTIETRGGAAILMGWGDDVAKGPVEVRRTDGVEPAKAAAAAESGRALIWRDAEGDERKHGVVAAADVP
jgi:hypothetical protein